MQIIQKNRKESSFSGSYQTGSAGIKVDPEWKLDGVDLLPYLADESKKPHDTLYWRLGEQNAIRHGDWKLVQYDRNVEEYPTKGVTQAKLYNLASDIGESNDLASQHPEKVKELRSKWEAWSNQLAEPRWLPQAQVANSPAPNTAK